jgi:Domain of unknown function (DUF4279)
LLNRVAAIDERSRTAGFALKKTHGLHSSAAHSRAGFVSHDIVDEVDDPKLVGRITAANAGPRSHSMNSYKYTISLRVEHPSADPAEITSALGLTPSRTWRAGEPRSTAKGAPRPGENAESFWTATLAEGRWPEKALPDIISDLLDQLAARKDFFHRIRSEGGKAEFFVGWFFDGQSGDVFGCDLLARMADLKIDLSLDIYPPART